MPSVILYYLQKVINMISIKIINYVKNIKLKLLLLKILNNKIFQQIKLKNKKLKMLLLKITNKRVNVLMMTFIYFHNLTFHYLKLMSFILMKFKTLINHKLIYYINSSNKILVSFALVIIINAFINLEVHIMIIWIKSNYY